MATDEEIQSFKNIRPDTILEDAEISEFIDDANAFVAEQNQPAWTGESVTVTETPEPAIETIYDDDFTFTEITGTFETLPFSVPDGNDDDDQFVLHGGQGTTRTWQLEFSRAEWNNAVMTATDGDNVIIFGNNRNFFESVQTINNNTHYLAKSTTGGLMTDTPGANSTEHYRFLYYRANPGVSRTTTAATGLKARLAKYIAAHFSTVADPLLSTEKMGDSQDTYEGTATGMNFQSSKFGRMAIALDPTDTLINIGKPQAKFYAVGQAAISRRRRYF